MNKILREYKINRISALVIIMALILNMVVIPAPSLAADLGVDVAKFTEVALKIDDVAVDINTVDPINQDESVKLIYDFVVSDGPAINVGDTISVIVPEGFLIANNVSGPIITDGTDIGTFLLDKDSRVLTLTFSSNVRDAASWSGQVVLNSQFELSEIPGDDNPVEIQFVINAAYTKNVTLVFAPKNVANAISKTGLADKEKNPTKIDWTVQLNKKLEPTSNVVLNDVFEEGLALDQGTIVVRELNVNLEGVATPTGSALTLDTDYTVEYVAGTRVLNISFGDINKAYEIKYATNILDITKTSFNNTTSYSGGSSEATVGISRGSLIEKAGGPDRDFNPREITWTIEANKFQGPLTGAQIVDAIPAGLTYKDNSAFLYEIPLNENGSVNEGSVVSLGSVNAGYIGGTKTLIVDLPNSNKAYRLVFVTTIDDTLNDSTYNNTSSLVNDGSTVGSANDSVTANYGVWINKTGSNVINYSTKAIDWTIDVNTVEKLITGGLITDVIPVGISIDIASVELRKRTFNNDGSEASSTVLVKSTSVNYDVPTRTLTVDLNQVIVDNPALGAFDFALRINYRTNIDSVDVTGPFANTAILTGTSGVGLNENSLKSMSPSIVNKVSKNYIENSLNYATKTMEWRIFVEPIKEPMQGLVITDTFPNGGLSFDLASLVIKKGASELVKETDYTVTSPGGDSKNGFVITFLSDVKDMAYTITYTTDFDRIWHTNAGAPSDYSNNAAATWTEVIGNKSDPNNLATKQISTTARDNGNKESGVLRRIDKEIDWAVNVNYLSETYTNYTVVDTIPVDEQDNHEVVQDSIKVYMYTLQSGGSITKGAAISEGTTVGTYSIVSKSATGFTIRLNGEINSPYRIEYTTKLINDTISTYHNDATFGGKTVSGSVSFTNANTFVSKNNPPSGISLNWEVRVNTSLSTIQDGVLTDTIGYGHEYDKGSLKVYKVTNGGNVLVGPTEYTTTYKILNATTGEQQFNLAFNNTIGDEYIVKYTTKVYVTSNQSVSNTAQFVGTGIVVHNESTTYNVAIAVTTGYSSALAARELTESKGDLTITKVDGSDNTLLSGAVYDLLDSNKNVIATLTATDAFGITKAIRLDRAIYYLVEKVAPTGYQLPNPNLITVDMTAGTNVNMTLENFKTRTLVLEKVARYNTGTKLAGAVFDLYGPIGKTTATTVRLTTDVNGLATFDNLLFGDYTLTEVSAPAGYEVINRVTSITINSSKTLFEVTIENQIRSYVTPTVPTEPIVPIIPVIPVTPTTPTIPVVPTNPTNPTTPVKKEEVTVKDTPVTGTVVVPVNSDVSVSKDPVNGFVTVDINGKWEYKPNPGYVGNDSFIIIVRDPNGEEEEFEIDIFVEEIPEGIFELPKTGGIGVELYGLFGASLIGTGLVLRKRKKLDR